MKRLLKALVWIGVAVLCAAIFYGFLGYRDARNSAERLIARADSMIEQGRGGASLGVDRRAILLMVEDPAFLTHVGFDLTTPGAGHTTITQSLAKREGFADFSPGLQKLRQTGYAIGLERSLTKQQILALFLDTVPMGNGPDGTWINGFFAASFAHFGAEPDHVALDDFLKLVAAMIAPRDLAIADADHRLADRIRRIKALAEARCEPMTHGDVWLDGCAGQE